MPRWLWILREYASQLWVRASLYGLVGGVTALAAIYLQRFIPEDISQRIGADAVDGILNIMAASMLSVTIFSLGAMVAAYGAASSNVTPRATRLLIEDKLSHKALSTFIGSFIFSIVGIVALKTGVYGESGRLVLFAATIFVLVMIVLMLLRWIEYLTRLGRMNETIERVERAATAALTARLANPYMGGVCLDDPGVIPEHAAPVYAGRIGYVQCIDMAHLSHIAERHDLRLYIRAVPGKFLDEYYPLVMVEGDVDDTIKAQIHSAFITGEERVFTEDPRYGIAVLCEIGTRALSAAINDTGTPIYVIGIGVRIFSIWAKRAALAGEAGEADYPRIHVPPLRIEDLFGDFFPAIARDGAHILEVQIRLQKAFAALSRTGDADLARLSGEYARLSLQRAQASGMFEADFKTLSRVAAADA